MSTTANPFLDPVVLPKLYEAGDRLARRTRALHKAKIAGQHAADSIADLAAASPHPPRPLIADIGCGRGSTTLAMAGRLPAARFLAVDASATMLTATRTRTAAYAERVRTLRADFHRLPLRNESCHLVVAAFCLYHSRHPEAVIREIARCLTPGGSAILATKSADSYRELDELVADCALDPDAVSRAPLYESAHSANLPSLVGTSLDVVDVRHDRHRFRFQGLKHLAEYLVTSPKYRLPPRLLANPAVLATDLGRRLADRPIEATSTVTYILGRQGESL